MRSIFFFMVAFLVFGCGQKESPKDQDLSSDEKNEIRVNADDTLAIENIIEIQTRTNNFEEREKIWADDGRWLQAFGRVFYGKDSIINFIKLLHGNPGFAASAGNKYGDPEIKFLRSDVAIVHQYHERDGQLIDGLATPTRKINTTYVLTKENGTWLLRDKVTMDERSRGNE